MANASYPTDELLTVLAALYTDDVFNSTEAGRRGDVLASMSRADVRAMATRTWLRNEQGGENPEWRMGRFAELVARGDTLIKRRAVELQRAHMADFTKRREEAQRQTFKWTADPNLNAHENERAMAEALRKHMSDPVRVAEAIRHIQKTQEGMLFNNPDSNYFATLARAEVENERPWLFAHLKDKAEGGLFVREKGGEHVKRGRSVNDLANDLLERHPVHTSKRTAAAMTLDRTTRRYVPRACTAEEKALARDILETYRAHDALISGTPSMTQEQCAESLARAVSSMGDKGPRFLATCMRAAGIR